MTINIFVIWLVGSGRRIIYVLLGNTDQKKNVFLSCLPADFTKHNLDKYSESCVELNNEVIYFTVLIQNQHLST